MTYVYFYLRFCFSFLPTKTLGLWSEISLQYMRHFALIGSLELLVLEFQLVSVVDDDSLLHYS